MNKILIIGNKGQLGADMMKLCEQNAYNTVGVDYPEIDITNKESVFTNICNKNYSLLINCAAYTAVDAATDADLARQPSPAPQAVPGGVSLEPGR